LLKTLVRFKRVVAHEHGKVKSYRPLENRAGSVILEGPARRVLRAQTPEFPDTPYLPERNMASLIRAISAISLRFRAASKSRASAAIGSRAPDGVTGVA
jgi:hypothetical protein